MTTYSLEELKRIVLEENKVPYYNRRHGKTTIATILDKEGLHTVIYEPFNHHLKEWDDVTEEDVMLLVEALEKIEGEKQK